VVEMAIKSAEKKRTTKMRKISTTRTMTKRMTTRTV
jgi:hypothetical protein